MPLRPPDADPYARNRSRLEITTSNADSHPGGELWEAQWTLKSWLHNDGTRSPLPATSHAALTVWLAARDREYRAKVLTAIRSEQLITIDGTSQPFLTLSSPAGRWVAVRRHDDLTITIAAHDLDRRMITIEPIRTPPAAFFDRSPRRREAAARVTLRPDRREVARSNPTGRRPQGIDKRTLRSVG